MERMVRTGPMPTAPPPGAAPLTWHHTNRPIHSLTWHHTTRPTHWGCAPHLAPHQPTHPLGLRPLTWHHDERLVGRYVSSGGHASSAGSKMRVHHAADVHAVGDALRWVGRQTVSARTPVMPPHGRRCILTHSRNAASRGDTDFPKSAISCCRRSERRTGGGFGDLWRLRHKTQARQLPAAADREIACDAASDRPTSAQAPSRDVTGVYPQAARP
jgi:hypothetical protein